MANFEPNEYEPEIVEAEIVHPQSQHSPNQYSRHQYSGNPMPPKRESVSVFVILCILAAVFLVFAMVVTVPILLMLRADDSLSQNGVGNEVTEKRFVESLSTSNQKWESVFAAFSEPESDVSDKTLKAIENSLDKIISVSKNHDAEAMRHYVHQEGFLDQMTRSKLCTLNYFDRRMIKSSFEIVTDGPTGFEKHQIASVKQLDEDEALVYLYLWGTDGGIREYCFWMRENRDNRSRGRWQVSDWESLRTGISEAATYALIVEEQDSQGIQQYYNATEATAAGLELAYEGENDKAIKKFNQALGSLVHPRLQDTKNMSAGFGMANANQWEQAIEIFEDMANKSVAPGGYYGLCLAHNRLGNYQEALTYADEYLNRVGPSPTTLYIKATALHQLEENDKALDQLKSLLKLTPDDDEVLESFVRWLPPERADELVEVLGDDSEKALALARKTYLHSSDAILNTLAEIVETNGGGKAKSLELKGLAAMNRFEYPEAAELFLKAMKAESEPEAVEAIQGQYLDIMIAMDKPIEGFLASPLKDESFEYLTYGYNEFEIPAETLLELVVEYRKLNVESKWLDYVEASALVEQEKFEEAKPLLERGLKMARKLEKPNDKTDLAGEQSATRSYEYYLRNVLMNLEQPKQAMLVGSDRSMSFRYVAQALTGDEKFDELKPILSDFKSWSDANPPAATPEDDSSGSAETAEDLIRYYDASIRFNEGNEEAATTLFDFMAQEKFYFLKINAQTTLRSWLLKNNKWQSALKPLAKSKSSSEEDRKGINQLFESIFDLKLDEQSYDDIDELTKLHKTLNLEADIRKVWQLRVAQRQDDAKAFLRIANSLSDEQFENISYYLRSQLAQHWIDLLLQMDKNPAAMKKANKFVELGIEQDKGINQFLCHVSARDTQSCREILEDTDYFFYSPLSARAIGKDYYSRLEFKELRNEFPVSINYRSAQANSLQLMFNEKPDLDELENKILALLSTKAKPSSTIELDTKIQRQRVINLPQSQILISLTSRQLTGYEDDPETKLPEHTFVFSISQTAHINNLAFTPEQVLASLVDENCVGVYLPDHYTILSDPGEWLKNREPNEKIQHKLTENVYLYFSELDSDSEDKELQYWAEQKNQIARLAELKKELSSGAKNLEALIEFSSGSLVEKHWFPIERFEPDENQQIKSLIVRRNAKVVLFPELQAGEPHEAFDLEGLEWRESE